MVGNSKCIHDLLWCRQKLVQEVLFLIFIIQALMEKGQSPIVQISTPQKASEQDIGSFCVS